MPNKTPQPKIFENADELHFGLADYVAELSEAAVRERGTFAVALSGSLVISFLTKLCETPYRWIMDWSKWHVFWADEAVAARSDPDSSFDGARILFFSKVPILHQHIYSIDDTRPAEDAASEYQLSLRQLVKTKIVDVSKSSDYPRFDLVLLEMGADGHVASLFPGYPQIHETEQWITFVSDLPKPSPERITVTLPVINSAANVVVVATGARSAGVLAKVFGENMASGMLPAQMVSPVDGTLVWFVDKEAASELPVSEQRSEGSHVSPGDH